MKVLKVFLFSFLNLGSLFAQVGGDNTYEFLNLTTSARISALGNVLVNSYDNDVNLAQQIPSLNHTGMNHQLALNFTNYYAGIKFGSLIYGIPSSCFENISVGMKYLNYGDFTRADEFGNVIGIWRAKVLKNLPLPIVGDGNQKRDFTHVYDIVDGLLKISNSKINNLSSRGGCIITRGC